MNNTYLSSSRKPRRLCLTVMLVTFAIFFFQADNAFSQKKKDFFEHDYAGKIGTELGDTIRNSDNPTSSATPTSIEESKAEFVSPENEIPSIQPSASETPVDDRPIAPGKRIRSLGVVVNALDQAHYEKVLKELMDTSVDFEIPIGDVFAVGGAGRNMEKPAENLKMNKYYLSIGVQGGKFMQARKLPEKYAVKSSPSWIVALDDGEVVIEGFETLDKFINAKGEFVPAQSIR